MDAYLFPLIYVQLIMQYVMVLNHSRSGEMTRIPLRCFAAHALLSALAVAIPQLFQFSAGTYLKDATLFLSWNTTHICGFLVHIILSFRNFDININYSIAASHIIASLHVITLLLGKYVSDPSSGFTQRQHIVVHFCLVFYVITELEFYRAYANFKKFDTYTDAFKRLHLANADPTFTYCRDPFSYILDLPNTCRYNPNSDNEPRTFWASCRPYCAFSASCLLFHAVGGLANYLIKCMVNPDPRCDWISAMMNGLVFFGSYQASYWELILGFALLRAVRQANYVGFWVVVEFVKRLRASREMADVERKIGLESRYKTCPDCYQR